MRVSSDAILVDVQMPEMDEPATSRQIRSAMTANATQDDRERCLAAEVDDYVSKPICVDELVAAPKRCPVAA
jgi:CheY-like chemotaxis protein